MIDRFAITFLLFGAIGFLVSIWRERAADERALLDQRLRLYQGRDHL